MRDKQGLCVLVNMHQERQYLSTATKIHFSINHMDTNYTEDGEGGGRGREREREIERERAQQRGGRVCRKHEMSRKGQTI